eukprot:6490521-Amphidinium_carterae.1
MILTGRARTDKMEDEFYSLKKTSDGSIRLVCFRCWNEFENTDKYLTKNGKPSSAFRKKTDADPHRQDAYAGASDWVTAVGPGKNVVQLYFCEAWTCAFANQWVVEGKDMQWRILQ